MMIFVAKLKTYSNIIRLESLDSIQIQIDPNWIQTAIAPRKYQAGARDHARRGGFYGHTVSTDSRNLESFLHQRDHPQAQKKNLRKHQSHKGAGNLN